MDNFEHKRLALLRILEILQKYSDDRHPIMQDEIAQRLERDYGIKIERKAIGRNISLLKEAGYDIMQSKKGSYLVDRNFEDSELRMLIDGVLTSKYITERHSKDLIEKLCRQANVYFRSHVKNIYSVGDWSKTDNCEVFYNIEIIDEAIEKGKQITFDYNKYGADKKMHKTDAHTASPYQLILHNQRYYLMALSEKYSGVSYYRLDRITNIQISNGDVTDIRTLEGYQSGINYRKLASSLPYMFSDMPEEVEFLANENIIDQVLDWFGFDVKLSKQKDGRIKVSACVSPKAMGYWALQYVDSVEVISPLSLRQTIKESLKDGLKKYE